MTETFRCGDESALVAFLYDECEPAERETIAAHVASCLRCTSELDSLSATRRHLSLWTPPDARLGFRISSDQLNSVVDGRSAFAAAGGREGAASAPWWRQPLPAWAQAAAAVLVFVAGMAVGTSRGEIATSPVVSTSNGPGLSQIAALERRMARMEQAQGRLVAAEAPSSDEGRSDLIRWTKAEINASERRQHTLLAAQVAQLAWEQTELQRDADERVAKAVDQELDSFLAAFVLR